MSKSERVLGAVIAGTLLIVALVFLLPVLSRAREQARRSSCGNNLGNLVKCCQRYADTHGGCWPERLSQLYPKYMNDIRVFNCPSAPGPKVLTVEDIDTKSSYQYFPKRIQEEGVVAGVIEERRGNHPGPGGGRNVAIAAGSIEWWDDSVPRTVKDAPKP